MLDLLHATIDKTLMESRDGVRLLKQSMVELTTLQVGRASARPLSNLQYSLASETLPTLLVTVLLLPLLFTLLPAGSGGESVVAADPVGTPGELGEDSTSL